MEPTQEQRIEFWEGCGFTQLEWAKSGWHYEQTQKVMNWTHPSLEYGSLEYLPRIDLNNLFRYAVPKAGWCSLEHIIMTDPMGFPKKEYQKTYTEQPPAYYFGRESPRWHWYRATVWDKDGNNKLKFDAEDPALALFWAIYEATQ